MPLKIILFITCMFLISLANHSYCQKNSNTPHRPEQTMSVNKVLERYSETLLALPGVQGTAQSLCDKQPCIRVYVDRLTPELEKRIGDILTGHLFTIKESTKFKKRSP